MATRGSRAQATPGEHLATNAIIGSGVMQRLAAELARTSALGPLQTARAMSFVKAAGTIAWSR
jgi:hypothetical protein